MDWLNLLSVLSGRKKITFLGFQYTITLFKHFPSKAVLLFSQFICLRKVYIDLYLIDL